MKIAVKIKDEIKWATVPPNGEGSTALTFFDKVLRVDANGETNEYEFDPKAIY